MTKSRKIKKTTTTKKSDIPAGFDDYLETSLGYMARSGRYIEMRNLSTPEHHEEIKTNFIQQATAIQREQEELRNHLIEVLGETDPMDLVARASMKYLQSDPNTYKEWEDDRSPSHIEYLALQALSLNGAGRADSLPNYGRDYDRTFAALSIVRKMFNNASMLLVIEALAAREKDPSNRSIEYVLKTRLSSLGIRGSAYDEHLVDVLKGTLGEFSGECTEALGFDIHDALRMVEGIHRIIQSRIDARAPEAQAGFIRMAEEFKRERRKGRRSGYTSSKYPSWALQLSPSEGKLYLAKLIDTWMFHDAKQIGLISPQDLAESCSLDIESCLSFLRAFTCGPEEFIARHHAYPTGQHPLVAKPFMQVDDGFLCPSPATIIESLRQRLEDLLREKLPPKKWEKYLKARGSYVERRAVELLSGALPGSISWKSLQWNSSANNSDLDGLVAADDVTLLIQCKAGRLSGSARRGSPERMRRDIDKLIKEAAGQHEALNDAIREEGASSLGFDANQAKALNSPFSFEVIVCLDDITTWATHANELKGIEALPAGRNVPWILSLTDLMVVVELLQGSHLINYLTRRQRLERDSRIKAHDELDWVGHYILEGLFFDQMLDGPGAPNIFRLLSYTEPIDSWYFWRSGVRTVETPKPTPEVPEGLRRLIERLEQERPEHWATASLGLLCGDGDSRDQWNEAIARVSSRLSSHGWCNTSQVFGEGLGVTLHIDHRYTLEGVGRQARKYIEEKTSKLSIANWIVIYEGRSGEMAVEVRSSDPNEQLADFFMNPRSVGAERTSATSESGS
ncbi:hypothetical protein [Actinocorallia aurantiaca]|uniref:Restriction endonuclease type IV Mrr domain-containing protein n=1 Tax=Actinocorallia aurantiaca TaxID=46204 RepID=A0ABN3UZ34_9ACTN